LDARVCRAGFLARRGDYTRATDEADAAAGQEGLHSGSLLNIGCVFARSAAAAENDSKIAPSERNRLKAQYANRAMEFLHQAVARGLQNAAQIKTDPDLAPLRPREDFQKLVQEVEQKSKK
jgi:hypothetical protein